MDEQETSEKAKRWREYAEKPLEERREHYKCGERYTLLSSIDTWQQYHDTNIYYYKSRVEKGKKIDRKFPVNARLNAVVSLWSGDITALEIDAIVNAANSSLLGGGGVDGCIHRAAGSNLRKECATLGGCKTGQAKITLGHNLPAKYVIHTVGPIGKNPDHLEECYSNCLRLVKENDIKSIAFCCISTGIYGYPNRDAAHVALATVREWLDTDDNCEQVERIIFCTFLPKDVEIYEELLLQYFPCEEVHGTAEQAPPQTSEEPSTSTAAEPTDKEEDITQGIPEAPKIEDFVQEVVNEEENQ